MPAWAFAAGIIAIGITNAKAIIKARNLIRTFMVSPLILWRIATKSPGVPGTCDTNTGSQRVLLRSDILTLEKLQLIETQGLLPTLSACAAYTKR